MEASKIQAQQLQDCFERIESDSGIAGILDEVSKYCQIGASVFYGGFLAKEYREHADMITMLANKIRIREGG